jgi:hypothetical protein
MGAYSSQDFLTGDFYPAVDIYRQGDSVQIEEILIK